VVHQGEIDGVDHRLTGARLAQLLGRRGDADDAGATGRAFGRQHQGPAVDDGFTEKYDQEDLKTRVQDALGRLPARQREVIARYYGDELTLREAGAKMGVSEARACQLHGRAIQSLRRELSVHITAAPARMAQPVAA